MPVTNLAFQVYSCMHKDNTLILLYTCTVHVGGISQVIYCTCILHFKKFMHGRQIIYNGSHLIFE